MSCFGPALSALHARCGASPAVESPSRFELRVGDSAAPLPSPAPAATTPPPAAGAGALTPPPAPDALPPLPSVTTGAGTRKHARDAAEADAADPGKRGRRRETSAEEARGDEGNAAEAVPDATGGKTAPAPAAATEIVSLDD